MAKGIVYVTTSEIDGLVKIGKTQNIKKRMKELSTDGYLRQKCDVIYAIEVEDYEAKEKLLHTIFGKGRAARTEFFAEDVEVVIQTLSAFEGRQVYLAETEITKENSFKEATSAVSSSELPNGIYNCEVTSHGTKHVCKGILEVENGKMCVKAGSVVSISATTKGITKGWVNLRNSAVIDSDNVLVEDVPCKSVSQAAYIVIGTAKNGWDDCWKDKNGNPIAVYR